MRSVRPRRLLLVIRPGRPWTYWPGELLNTGVIGVRVLLAIMIRRAGEIAAAQDVSAMIGQEPAIETGRQNSASSS